MGSGAPRIAGRVEVRRLDDDVPSDDAEVRVRAEDGAPLTFAALEGALWAAARQLWPDWPTGTGGLLDRARLREMQSAAEAERDAPPAPAEALLGVLGAPTVAVESPRLDEPAADATSRALERLATLTPVRWLVPDGAAELDGVVRLGGVLVTPARTEPTPSGRKQAGLRVAFRPIVGRPHPASPAELRLARAIEASPDLAGRFAYNHPVPTAPGTRPIVDAVCADGGLAVEVDGFRFHRSRAAFGHDRQRDFELACSGWRVLRLTHDEVMEATAACLDKIRAVLAAPKRPTDEREAE